MPQLREYYWPESQPADNTTPLLSLTPTTELKRAPSPQQLEEQIEGLGWQKDENNGLLLRMGNWMQLQPTEVLSTDGKMNGLVTIDSIAYHVRRNSEGFLRYLPWTNLIGGIIHGLGYKLAVAVLDFEAPICDSGYRYQTNIAAVGHDRPGAEYLTMHEVLRRLYANDRWSRHMPRLDLESACSETPYNSKRDRQTMIAWNHFIAMQNAGAWTRAFVNPLKSYWPNLRSGNYDNSMFEFAPGLDFNSGLPRANCKVGSDSCPVLYLSDGYFTGPDAVEQSISFLNTVKPPMMPWMGGRHWIGRPNKEGEQGWYYDAENWQRQYDAIAAVSDTVLFFYATGGE